MNVTNKTTRTYALRDITEDQATDLLNISIKLCETGQSQFTVSEIETVNAMRQALLHSGSIKRGDNAD